MMKTTFINKYAGSGNVAHSTHEERRLINERSREYRRPRQVRKGNQKKLQEVHNTKWRCEHLPSKSNTKISPADISTCTGTHIILLKDRKPVPTAGSSPFPFAPKSVTLRVYKNPGNSTDPFHASSIPPSETMIQLLNFYKQVYYDHVWDRVSVALDGEMDVYGVVQSPRELIIFECMKNRARINTLLASIGCHLKYIYRGSTCINTDELVLNAVEALREEFRNKSRVDSGMFCDALHLYLAISAIDQSETAKAHLQGVRAIMQKIIDQGDRIYVTQAALFALVDTKLAKQLLRDPERVCQRVQQPLGPIDVKYLGTNGYPVDDKLQVLV